MRRAALLGFLLLLSGCTGFGNFLTNVHTIRRDVNTPVGNSETLDRVRADPVPIAPLRPEQGNVWPGPIKPQPTLMDMEKEMSSAPATAPFAGGAGDPASMAPLPALPDHGGQGHDGIRIPNGDGTDTLIRPNGSVTTVPAKKP